MKGILLFLTLVFAGSALGQVHQPTATATTSFNGHFIRFDADWVWWDSNVLDPDDVRVIFGVPLQHPSILASHDGVEGPILIEVPGPGTYTFNAAGYRDPGTAQGRNLAVLNVTVEPQSRSILIQKAYIKFFDGRDMWQQGKDELKALDPTKSETEQALR